MNNYQTGKRFRLPCKYKVGICGLLCGIVILGGGAYFLSQEQTAWGILCFIGSAILLLVGAYFIEGGIIVFDHTQRQIGVYRTNFIGLFASYDLVKLFCFVI